MCTLVSRFIFFLILISLMAAGSVWYTADALGQIRILTRPYEFDYIVWTAGATVQKLHSASLGSVRNFSEAQKRAVLRDYFKLLNEVNHLSQSIEIILADPDPRSQTDNLPGLRETLFERQQRLNQTAVLAESIVQDYVSQALGDLGLADLRQPFPPVLYHVTDVPNSLILSPRGVIRQEKSVSLQTDLTPFDVLQLENQAEDLSDFSALVVQVGGIGTYPAMVTSTSSLPYLFDTVAHEWTHHYLTLRPLGMRYFSSPGLRTMNETVASIAGQEISDYIIRKHFSDLLTPVQPHSTYEVSFPDNPFAYDGEPFNFRQEMYLTRLKVDELLGENRIEEAEEYMDVRRVFFWDNGYQIRRLNQAYFAFHGAYADQPFSAAGADPVGEDVRVLRDRVEDLAGFLRAISRLTSYETLRGLVRSY
jgi:hypothetical protein